MFWWFYMCILLFVLTQHYFVRLFALSSLMFYALFYFIYVSFGICFCIMWVLLRCYFYCFSHFQLPCCAWKLLYCFRWNEMKVVHIFTCPPVLVFSRQANVHCIYSPIVSRSGMVLFFVAVRLRFMLQSRVFEGHREVLRVNCFCCFRRQLRPHLVCSF